MIMPLPGLPWNQAGFGSSPGLITPAISSSWTWCTHNIGPTSGKINCNQEWMHTFMWKILLHWCEDLAYEEYQL